MFEFSPSHLVSSAFFVAIVVALCAPTRRCTLGALLLRLSPAALVAVTLAAVTVLAPRDDTSARVDSVIAIEATGGSSMDARSSVEPDAAERALAVAGRALSPMPPYHSGRLG